MITFPWVPALNQGRHKLVSEPTTCRTPPSNSLGEVESSHWKNYFTNFIVWLMGPHLNWVILGSFSSHLYSGTLISHLFGLKILLTLTLGSRDYFLPETPHSR